MTRRYAASTAVSTSRSRDEIERTLQRYGATGFVYGWRGERALVGFEADGRQVRMELPLPPLEDFRHTPAGRRRRSDGDMRAAWDQACRQAWRALALVVKAKLEAVEAGIAEFEDEFLAYMVLPGGRTVGEEVRPRLEAVYAGDLVGPMLPELGAGGEA